MSTDILNFTREALATGIPRDDISQALRQAGWPEEDIRNALGAFAEVDFAIPVPRRRPYLTARELFMYMVMFSTLYVCAYHLGSIAFEFINRAFPDSVQPQTLATASVAIRMDVSSLIVAFPLFLFVFRSISTAVAKDPIKRESRPRKFLTYLTLFIAGILLCGDLVSLVYRLFGGELTVRFILKVLTIATIAGGTFLYFLLDIRKGES
ncbi:MAG: DUF5671 domain-containing protein [Alphaproteobacteria bacterium]